jgi:hypothetical protein
MLMNCLSILWFLEILVMLLNIAAYCNMYGFSKCELKEGLLYMNFRL